MSRNQKMLAELKMTKVLQVGNIAMPCHEFIEVFMANDWKHYYYYYFGL